MMSRYALIQDVFNGLKSLQEENRRESLALEIPFNPMLSEFQNPYLTDDTTANCIPGYRRWKNDR